MGKVCRVAVMALLILLTTNTKVASEPPGPDTWVHGETSVSGLSLEDKERLMMPLRKEEEVIVARAAAMYRAYAYPAELDWRDQGGLDFTTPIRDQGPCGSCVAFAVVASIEARFELATAQPHLNPDWSEAQAFFCGCGACCQTGAWPDVILDYLQGNGLVSESCFSYTPQDQPCLDCAPAVGLTSWVRVDGEQEMKQALMGGPVTAIMEVYQDFFYYQGGIYWPDNVIVGPIGLHAITLVGYKDVGAWPHTGYWIAKNSWGPGWGEEGWFKVWDRGIVWLQAYVPMLDAESAYKVYAPLVLKQAP